jgi:ribosomal protein S3
LLLLQLIHQFIHSFNTFKMASTRRLSTKKKFVADGVFYAELNELLTRELAEDGYAGVEVRTTPHRTEIIIRATRTQNVLGENGRRMVCAPKLKQSPSSSNF